MFTLKMFLRGLITSERLGGWGRAFYWVRLNAACVRMEHEMKYHLAA